MKYLKRYFISYVLFGIITLFIIIFAIKGDSLYGAINKKTTWTILVFMNGDNNLEDYAIGDVNEMEMSIDTSKYSVIVEFDRHPDYDASNGDWSDTRRYFITPDTNLDNTIRSSLIEDLGERNMGDPNELIEFATWGIQNYPADNYLLIIWDHGDGWYKKEKTRSVLKGISDDETDGDMLGVADGEYAYAMDSISKFLGKKLDILANDACLMGMQEVAYEIKDYVAFIVFSEYFEPGDGYPYDDILNWLNTNSNATPEDLSKIIVEKYTASYMGGSQGTADVTQSAVRLDNRFLHLSDCIDRFAIELMKIGGRSNTEVDSAYCQTQGFGLSYGSYSYFYSYDIYDFASRVKERANILAIVKEWADSVMQTIDSTVVKEAHYSSPDGYQLDYSHGLSIYYPQLDDIDTTYENLTFAQALPNWYEFITGTIIGISDEPKLTNKFTLVSLIPNPTTKCAVVKYTIPQKTKIEMNLYDLSGKLIKVLHSEEEEAGEHIVEINSNALASGVYFLKLKIDNIIHTQKLIVVK